MSFVKSLQVNINKVADGYFANWTPDMPISVGDYGFIRGYRFTRDGNVTRYNLDLQLEENHLKTALLEKKDGVIVNAQTMVTGSAGTGKTKLDLQFGDAGSFLYHLKGLTNIQYKDRRSAFEKIGQLILSDRLNWQDDYVLVVEVKKADRAVIIVADSDDAKMEIECDAFNSGSINLADVAGNIGYTRDSDRVLRYETYEPISPLFRVVAFSDQPPGGGSISSVSSAIAKVRSWFVDKMPEPERIFLIHYVESASQITGTFEFPNNKTISLLQNIEDINGLIRKTENSELEATLEIEKEIFVPRTLCR